LASNLTLELKITGLTLAHTPILGENARYDFIQLPHMKILAVSDETIERLYNPRVRDTYPDVRLIFGCGDLDYTYLEFLLTIFNVPLFYVPGNHDPQFNHKSGAQVEGGVNVDGKVVLEKGLLLAGLGGSIMYHPGEPNQYSQQEMYLRVYQLLPKILLKSFKHHRPLDVLITHSPPAGIHDDTDLAHRGLLALNLIIKVTKPRFMLHGHTIYYKHNIRSHITQIQQTQVINIYPFRILDFDV